MKTRKWKLAILTAILCIFLVLITSRSVNASEIREVHSSQKNLIPVRTAIGFSTIIEFQSKPLSAVLGDQDAFKLEYVGTSITIKPVIANAKTNLFVYTEFERFNFSIQNTRAENIDYIVRVFSKSAEVSQEAKADKTAATQLFQSIQVNRKASFGGFTVKISAFKLNSERSNPRAASLIEFELSSSKIDYNFQPASIGIKQGASFIEVESLFLEKTELKVGEAPIHGVIAILNQEWTRLKPLTLIFAIQEKDKKANRIEVHFNSFKSNPIKKAVANGKMDLFPKQSR